MLKTLLKKQANELFAILFMGAARSQSKKKKKRSAGSNIAAKIILFGVLFAIIFLGMCAWSAGMIDGLVAGGFDWMYFTIFGIMALLASIAFNAFIAYNMLFRAKDNMLLLSMPIQPRLILFSRMAVLFMNCVIVCIFAWVPAVIMYAAFKFSAAAFIFGILMIFIISMASLAFACFIGWFVALITKNQITKIILSIVGAILLIVVVVAVRGFMSFLMVGIIQNMTVLNEFVMFRAPWLFVFGRAAMGDAVAFLIVLAIGLVLFVLVYFIMSKTFMFVVMSKTTGKHKVYKAKAQKANKLSSSLLKKEFIFFFKTPVYLINAGFGAILLLFASIACIFAIPAASEVVPLLRDSSLASSSEFPFNILSDLIPIGILLTVLFLNGFSTITAPSISVEGKTIWILKSLPVKTYEIFKAKLLLHVWLNMIPAALFIIIAGIACGEPVLNIFIMIIGAMLANFLFAYWGLFVGILRANLVWTNITVPIKQNLAILFGMLFNILIIVIYIVGFVMLAQGTQIPGHAYIVCFAIFCILVSLILDRWLRTSGDRRFATL